MLQKAHRSLVDWPLLPWRHEALSIGLGYGVCAIVRVLALYRRTASFVHANQVVQVERW